MHLSIDGVNPFSKDGSIHPGSTVPSPNDRQLVQVQIFKTSWSLALPYERK